ncbi:hypothetical protein COO60DRAFT_1457344 [Scenedesmus sp. NREL 46B-D3]|nr:hypothetical protein COO60DRAFT_1457344 [Scenedesmus sp. NREL 46B-D3]
MLNTPATILHMLSRNTVNFSCTRWSRVLHIVSLLKQLLRISLVTIPVAVEAVGKEPQAFELRHCRDIPLLIMHTSGVLFAALIALVATGAASRSPLDVLTSAVQEAANTLAGVVNSTRSAADDVALRFNRTTNAAGNLSLTGGAVFQGARNATSNGLTGVIATVANLTRGQ